ncbi:hypothetical protein NM688_g2334 [Phlebia brevispora]|uniref:Uncharacterized protein n=1 Tax=Phlebia brevispora TaxID=194682 RepID=A0ACC1T8Z2_9APHY|nr:hypothetical protein NM688_g2334 [Phlebia brevispora]
MDSPMDADEFLGFARVMFEHVLEGDEGDRGPILEYDFSGLYNLPWGTLAWKNPSMCLPQDFIDRTLSYLALIPTDGLHPERKEVKKNLGRCCLVSRIWRKLARPYLLQDIVWEFSGRASLRVDEVHAFRSFLERERDICSNIRKLQLKWVDNPPVHSSEAAGGDPVMEEDDSVEDYSCALLSGVVRHIPRLRVLQLSGFPGFPGPVHSTYPALTSLQIDGGVNMTLSDIVRVIGAFSSISHLELRNLNLKGRPDSSTPTIPSDIKSIPHDLGLKSIAMTDVRHHSRLLFSLAQSTSIRTLQSLDVGPISTYAATYLSDIFRVVGPNLRHFGFDLYSPTVNDMTVCTFRDHYAELTHIYALDLSPLTCLRSLQVGLLVLMGVARGGSAHHDTGRLPTINIHLLRSLFAVLPHTLETITFTTRLQTYLPWVNAVDIHIAMEQLEDVLVPPIHHLRTVTFIPKGAATMPSDGARSLYEADLKQCLAHALGRLNARGLLRFG